MSLYDFPLAGFPEFKKDLVELQKQENLHRQQRAALIDKAILEK
jgi:hypothetical protein